MAKKKHAFHCEKCDSECMIYRKGRAHRVLVCPKCGVLATNGKFKDTLKGSPGGKMWGYTKKNLGGLEERWLGTDLLGLQAPLSNEGAVPTTQCRSGPKYSERVINRVMQSEGL